MRLRLEALAQAVWPEEWPHGPVSSLRPGQPLPADTFAPLTPQTIHQLTERLRQKIPPATSQLRRVLSLPVWWLSWLPAHPLVIDRLPSRVRTTFRRRGILADGSRLRELTGHRFLSLRGLGWRSLVDLIGLEESLLTMSRHGQTHTRAPARPTSRVGRATPQPWTQANCDATTPHAAVPQHRARAEPIVAKSLDDEIELILKRCTRSARDADIVSRRFGLRGPGTETLQQIADRHGLTRERVRQVVAAFERRARRQARMIQPVYLARLVDELRGQSPITRDTAERILAGHSGTSRRVDGLLRLASYVHVQIDGVHVLENRVNPGLRHALRAAMRVSGVGHIDEVRAIARQCARPWLDDNNADPERIAVRHAVRADCTLAWLDAAETWFWRPNAPRQPIETRVRKMLWVASELTLGEIVAGLGRDRRLSGRVPPDHVVAALLGRLRSVVETADGRYTLAPQALGSDQSPLSSSEALVVTAIRHEGDAASLRRMEELLVTTELMTMPTLHALLAGPLFFRPAPRVYSPVGGRPTRDALARALERSRPTRNRVAIRRIDADILEARITVGDALVMRGMLSLPSEIAPLFRSDYKLHHDGFASTIRTKGTTQWGYSPLVRRLRLRRGDVLSLAISVRERAIVVVVVERAGGRV